MSGCELTWWCALHLLTTFRGDWLAAQIIQNANAFLNDCHCNSSPSTTPWRQLPSSLRIDSSSSNQSINSKSTVITTFCCYSGAVWSNQLRGLYEITPFSIRAASHARVLRLWQPASSPSSSVHRLRVLLYITMLQTAKITNCRNIAPPAINLSVRLCVTTVQYAQTIRLLE